MGLVFFINLTQTAPFVRNLGAADRDRGSKECGAFGRAELGQRVRRMDLSCLRCTRSPLGLRLSIGDSFDLREPELPFMSYNVPIFD